MYCRWVPIGDMRRCELCGRTIKADLVKPRLLRRCPSAAAVVRKSPAEIEPPCKNRGPLLRVLGCCGEPRKTVYACEQYTECTLKDWKLTVDDDPSGELMGVCEWCSRRNPSPPA